MLSLDGYFSARILASIQVSEMLAECRLSNVFLPAPGGIIRNKACLRMKTSLRRHVRVLVRLVRNIMKRFDKYFTHPRAFGDTMREMMKRAVEPRTILSFQSVGTNHEKTERMQHGRR